MRDYRPGAPDLAVEVVSPNDTHAEVMERAPAWLGAGCRMVLVADPERRTVTIYRSRSDIRILTTEDSIDGADVVPGWGLPLVELFGQRDQRGPEIKPRPSTDNRKLFTDY